MLSGAGGERSDLPRSRSIPTFCTVPDGNDFSGFVIVRTAVFSVAHQNPNMPRDPRYYSVYIMGSLSGTLYIGFSGNLHKRVFQHKFHHFEGFTDKYDVTRLLYWESYDDVHRALARETQLKGWARAKKIALIVRRNPHWVDLAAEWYPWMRGEGRDASTPQ